MENKVNKKWKTSLILTLIATILIVLYIITGINSLILVYVPQEGFDALALLVLLPILFLLGLAALILVIISLITSIKNLKLKHKKISTILFIIIDSLIILIIAANIIALFAKNLIS